MATDCRGRGGDSSTTATCGWLALFGA